ncbi:MAG: hypothetical protein LBD61_04220 [Endomicrobium sp.]|nr:hypothetical protein [Endomicrobium sp.]
MRKILVKSVLVFMLTIICSAIAFCEDPYSSARSLREAVLAKNFGSTPVNILSINDMNKNLLIGNIQSVLHYRNGQLIATQERDGTITLYDSAGYRATITEDIEGSGVWRLSNFSLRFTDINEALKGKTKDEQKQAIVEFLISVGFGQNARQFIMGNPVSGTGGMGDEILSVFAKEGLNASFSFVQDEYGYLKCTLNLDGKPQNTFDWAGDLSQEWHYSSTGALEEYIVYHYETSETTGTTQGKWTATVTKMDAFGREIATSKCDVIVKIPNPNNPTLFPIDYELSSSTTVTVTYEYDKNGEKIAEIDHEKNKITYYGYGKPLEVWHFIPDGNGNPTEGSKTLLSRYEYYLGGSLKSVRTYNESGKQVEVTIYTPRGTCLGQSKDQDATPDLLFKQFEHVYELINNIASDADIQNLLDYLYDHNIGQISLRPTDFQNIYIFRAFCLNEEQKAEFDEKMLSLTNSLRRTPTIGEVLQALISDNSPEVDGIESEAYKLYKSVKSMYDSVSKMKSPITVGVQSGRTSRKVKTDQPEETGYVTSGSSVPIAGREHQVDHTTWGAEVNLSGGVLPEGLTWDDIALSSAASNNGQYEVNFNTYAYFDYYVDTSLKFSFEYVDEDGNHLKYGVTKNIRKEVTESGKRELIKTETMYYDPAVVGQAQAFVDADGNVLSEDQAREMIANGQSVYIQLNPQSINMFDGAGFQDVLNPQKGEQIYVTVEDMDMFNTFKDSVGTGAQVMVVGVVTNDMDGRMTMHVYNTKNGANIGFGLDSTGNKGYAVGENVSDMIEEINKLSQQEGSWVYKNTQTNRGIFQAAGALDSSGYLKDWKDGWAALARLAAGGNR